MKTKTMKFCEVPVGATMLVNGNLIKKVTNRTGRYIQYDRVFYFANAEMVAVLG